MRIVQKIMTSGSLLGALALSQCTPQQAQQIAAVSCTIATTGTTIGVAVTADDPKATPANNATAQAVNKAASDTCAVVQKAVTPQVVAATPAT